MRRRAVSKAACGTALPCIGACDCTGLTGKRFARARTTESISDYAAARAHTSDATGLGAAAAHAHRTSRRETSRSVTAGARGRGGHVRISCAGSSTLPGVSTARRARAALAGCGLGRSTRCINSHRVIIRTHTSHSTRLRAAAASVAAGAEMRRRAVSETARRTTLPCIRASRTCACLTGRRHGRGRSALRVRRNDASRAHTSDATGLGAAAAHAHRTSRRETSRSVAAGARGRGGHVRIGCTLSSAFPSICRTPGAGLRGSGFQSRAQGLVHAGVAVICVDAHDRTRLGALRPGTAVEYEVMIQGKYHSVKVRHVY